MKIITFFIIIMSINDSILAQYTWNDYIMGKPMMGYMEAKEAVAKEWGIEYKVEMLGCVLTEKEEKRMQELDAQNQSCFQNLEKNFGKDWQLLFNLDVRKKMFINDTLNNKGTWVEPVIGKPYLAHFDAKKIVAAKWGIRFEPYFLGCEVSPEVQAEAEQVAAKSADYERLIASHFGEDWQKYFEKELNFEIAKKNAPIVPMPDKPIANKETWSEIVIGKPVEEYFQAKQAVAKEWGIAYMPYFMGCKFTKKLQKQKATIEKTNQVYFKTLAERYGADWEMYFNIDVAKKRGA